MELNKNKATSRSIPINALKDHTFKTPTLRRGGAGVLKFVTGL